MVKSDCHDRALRELVEDEEAEKALFDEKIARLGISMCKFWDAPCFSPFCDRGGRPLCVLVKAGCSYYCGRIRFKGDSHWGISIKEKVERQKLLADDEGAKKRRGQ